MTIALATRGYLCFNRQLPSVCGPGPTITAIEEIAPDISGGAVVAEEGPDIAGGDILTPDISGAAEEPQPQPVEGPVISSGDDMVPTIKGGS